MEACKLNKYALHMGGCNNCPEGGELEEGL
jgi:hypothetical protein